MRNQYSYKNLETFFDQFKRMPEYITLEQVAQIIQHPSPAFSLPAKGISLRLWTILLSTTAVIIVASILYFSSLPNKDFLGEITPFKKEILPPVANIPAIAADTIKMEFQEVTEQKRQQKAHEKEVASADTNKSSQQLITQKSKKRQDQKPVAGVVDGNLKTIEEPVDGNPYIIDDLSLDELRKLGFDIQHYSVFYRNTWTEANCFFVSIFNDFIRYTEPGGELIMPGNLFRDLNELMIDTLPEKTPFYISINTQLRIPGQVFDLEYYQFKSTEKDFYPIYVSALDGSVNGIKPIEDFNLAIDTLVPVVLPFSRLNCKQTKDLIFWFHATEDFYDHLPPRYNYIKSIISNNKIIKNNNPNAKLVNYDIDRWISDRIYSPDEVIDGSDFIMELSREEQERIGLFRNKEHETSIEYSYRTPWGEGAGLGGTMKWIKTPYISNRDSMRDMVYDTVFNVDYFPKIITDTLGQDNSHSTTGKYLQSSLIENDILIPIKAAPRIYFFSQSDFLWSILPERYKYLKETYQKILFTKSIYPDIDLVRYFSEERKHIDMNVVILDLSKSELEKIGFEFFKDSLAIQSSVYNDEWIQFRVNLPGIFLKMPKERLERIIKGGLMSFTQVVNENNKDWQKENNSFDYDELVKSPFQGFHFVMVTDELGHELEKFRSVAREKYLSGKESKYLIPVRVPLNKYFSEYSETKIFWFTPTEDFFDRLPERIKKDLRKDFYSLTENLSNSTCTYFEECRSTLDLTAFSIYPNPTKDIINISFNTTEEITGNIYLLDIKGSIVKTLDSEVIFAVGNNEHSYSINDVLPGIYLIAVHTDAGIKTGRLIVSE